MTSLVTMATDDDESTSLLTISVTAEQESAMEAFFQINSWTLIKEDIKDNGLTERLVTLRVTPEQEAAMEAFFQINNWAFIKAVNVTNDESEQLLQQQGEVKGEVLEEVGQFQEAPQDHSQQETIVEEVQGLQEVQVAATGVNGQPQIITVYTEGSDAQGLPASLLADNRVDSESGGQQSHVIIQEITLPEGMTLDQGLVISNPQPVTRRVVPRGSMKPGDKLHKCHVCGKTFKQLQSFNGHYQSHFGAKPYQCEICNTGFTLKAALVAHHSIHTGSKPFTCTMCPKSFRRKDDMVSHVRTHTGEKPYECDICGKKFKYRNQIPKHRRAHTGEKPYKCQTCGKAFTSNIHLRRHERTHTGERPYKCQLCPKAFTQFGHLQAHMRIHTDERPFPCSICGRGFREKKVMKKHEALHTSERPYKCVECGKGFLRQSNLELHAVMHQKNTDGRPRTRPRPKKKLQADAEMREFVANVLSNVKKVDSGMQTETIVHGEPSGEDRATDNLAAFVDFAVEQESSQAMKVEPIGDLQHIAGGGQYTLVMQDDGSEGYLITNYDPNAVTGEIVTLPSQQVEISSEYNEGQAVTDYSQVHGTSVVETVVDSRVMHQTAEVVVEDLANVVSAPKAEVPESSMAHSANVAVAENILVAAEPTHNLLSLNPVGSLPHTHQSQDSSVTLLQPAGNLDGTAGLSGGHSVSDLTISHSGSENDVLQVAEIETSIVKPKQNAPCKITIVK